MKKGSLSLSVNAIVILILAITMLGLGLGFIKGMFGKVSQQVEEQISQEPAPSAASGSEPITLSRQKLITKPGETQVLKVGAYNPTSAGWVTNTITANMVKEQTDCTILNMDWTTAIPCTGTLTNTSAELCSLIDATTGTDTDKSAYCSSLGCSFTAAGVTCTTPIAGVRPIITCNGLSALTTQTNSKTIGVGRSGEFNVLMEMPEGTDITSGKNYLCQVSVATYSKDFTIAVTK
jgi:hypothetical protein